jgi:adenosylcobinamide kinase / adenosylcobinamide-phosphate guanylyltransferase
MLTLITGGCRSGKSTHALALASAFAARGKFFIATAEALDDEMRERIAHHRRSRPAEFETIEEPRRLGEALQLLHGRAEVVVVDCLTLWISNLLQVLSDDMVLAEAEALAATILHSPLSTIIVTDEVGWSVVPDNPVARRFRDLLGWTNQKIARAANEVWLMVSGYPLRVK